MKNNSKNRNKSNKGIKIVLFGSIGLLILAYLYLAFYYRDHFYYNTVINGVNASNLTGGKVESAINAEVESYVLTLKERNDVIVPISGEDIGLHTVFNGSIGDLLAKQNGFAWPLAFFKTNAMEIETMLEYDQELFDSRFDGLTCFKEENIVKPVNAKISKYGENGYEIIPEEPGNMVNRDKLYEAMKEAVLTLQPDLSLEEADCYVKPKVTSKSSKLVKALKQMNKIAGSRITYEFGEDTEVLDGSRISEWLSVDKKYKVNIDADGVKEYVDYIGKTYNSFGRVRTFRTSYGDVIKVKGGDYGWWLDRATEAADLTELIKKGEESVREPAYFQTAQQYGPDDIGDTYVEINLTAQHLFFYKEGKLIVETDFVSGNVSKNYGTPTGTYPIQYKENDATLNGEDYSTPVKYWMPFNGNIGLHDANWRDKFGKDIYLTSGSHGCINMPPPAAKKMFKEIKRGVAVVVYELPGTENYGPDEDENGSSGDTFDDSMDDTIQSIN